jgi:predicted transcriptional regulator
MGRSERRDRGGLEAELLAVLGATDEPMTARQVKDMLGSGLAYTTVMTTLARLHGKGALSRGLKGRAYAYRLAGDTREVDGALTARRMRKALDAGSNRSVALSRFVSELGPEDEQLLTEMLQRLNDDRSGGEAR